MNTAQRRLQNEINRTEDPLLREQLKEEFKAWGPYPDDGPENLAPLFKLQEIRKRYAQMRGESYRFYEIAPGIPDQHNLLPSAYIN